MFRNFPENPHWQQQLTISLYNFLGLKLKTLRWVKILPSQIIFIWRNILEAMNHMTPSCRRCRVPLWCIDTCSNFLDRHLWHIELHSSTHMTLIVWECIYLNSLISVFSPYLQNFLIQSARFGAGCYIEMALSYHSPIKTALLAGENWFSAKMRRSRVVFHQSGWFQGVKRPKFGAVAAVNSIFLAARPTRAVSAVFQAQGGPNGTFTFGISPRRSNAPASWVHPSYPFPI